MKGSRPIGEASSVTSTVRVRVILPLAAAMILLVAMFISMFIIDARQRQSEEIARTATSVENLFQMQFTEGVQLMRSIMELIMRDRNLEMALRARDRQTLFDISEPILKGIRDTNSITHFYYILPDSTVLLRVPLPDKHGDKIDRFGLQEVRRTGEPFWGYELGPFGLLTLRVTYPWYSGGKVIGYLEMGIELEDIIQAIHRQLDVDVFLAVGKKFLDRGKWESMKKRTGLQVDWNEFPAVVVLSQTEPEVPAPIAAYIAGLREQHVKRTFVTTWSGHIAYAIVLPFTDLRGRELGELVVLRDITATMSDHRNAIFWAVALGSMIGGALMVFFYVLLGRVQRDVIDRKQTEQDIRRLNEELEQKVEERTRQLLEVHEELVREEKLALLGRAAHTVGHELRNPLGVMNNAVYLLQAVLADADATTKEYLGIIKNEIATADHILTDMLDAVRTKPPNPEIVGVRELLVQALHECAVPSNVTVQLDIPETTPPLLVDPLQIQQVFRNLISNGVEAMPEGGMLEVRASAREEGKNVIVSIRDNGTGIAPEHFSSLFQPLFTTKARGIGMGLAAVKNLTEANGGSVEAQSELGKGSVFTVTLPCGGAAEETA